MNPLSLSQLQFAVTTVYHFFFVPLTLGLSVLVAIMETLYVRTGSEVYKRMVKFWGKLFIINFAMGVVTGIVQEFQFGMNWADYSRFVGDIFGAPLAIEALLAFFLESTFLGIWIFGWEKLSKKAHLAAIWLVAIGSNLSALWILIANSFMQSPVGFTVENGRAVMNDFGALVFNPYVWLQFPHTVLSGFTTAAFFVMGISVYHLLRRKEEGVFSRSFRLASIFGAVSILLVIFVGHSQAQRMVQVQPMKMAAAEALWESADPAPFSLFSAIDLPPQVLFSALIEEDFYLIHRADAADAPAAGEVCLEQALARPLVFPSQAHGHCTRTLVEHAVKQHGLAVGEIVMEVNSVHILKSAVEAGIGHTIMPLNLAVREIEDGRLVAHRIAADGLSRTLGICSCASMPASHLKTLISELIREVVRAMCAGGDWPGGRAL